jgi:hypothetical protein
MKLNKKQASFSIVLVLSVIGFLEITLNLLASVSQRIDAVLGTSNPIPHSLVDERLGGRPNPAYPGHDRLGFRNPKVPAKAHIVALGDSHTYGTGVESEEAWPKQLQSMTGEIVYSMAHGGYGPTHSLILWDEAVALKPRIVIEAFYAGNDLFESFDHVYNKGQLPELKSSDPELQARVREAEQSEPIREHVLGMFRKGKISVTRFSLRWFRQQLSQRSKIYGLLRRAWYESRRVIEKSNKTSQEKWEIAKALAALHPSYTQVFSNGQFKTVFTSEYRLSALNLEDPRIAEGLQISLRAIQRMHKFATARNLRFLVVLIPTKEAVFRQLWQNPPMSYRKVTEHEERFWTTTRDFLNHDGIEYLDALPALRKQLAAGIQPYQVSSDGHPNEYGHRAIARLVAAYLELSRTSKAQATSAEAHAAD